MASAIPSACLKLPTPCTTPVAPNIKPPAPTIEPAVAVSSALANPAFITARLLQGYISFLLNQESHILL
ncbi:MAG: hypothetical protein C5B45_04555 [Chlamydiae bacterium]|nr:MAG: hypothetical protein C5B45_04555 [Chlamydiota bacterium]